MRFPVYQRIRRKPVFLHVRQHGVRIHCGAFILQAARRDDPEAHPRLGDRPRLGVITSRRVGPAVVRNRARRLMREIFRENQHALPRGIDVVIVMRASYRTETFQSLTERFRKAGARLKRAFAIAEAEAPTNEG